MTFNKYEYEKAITEKYSVIDENAFIAECDDDKPLNYLLQMLQHKIAFSEDGVNKIIKSCSKKKITCK
jgi:hypothetical protein